MLAFCAILIAGDKQMLEKVSCLLADGLIRRSTAKERDRELYVYGFMVTLSTLFMMVSILLIGAVFFDFFSAALYLLVFTSLRVCSGGYHCGTYGGCFARVQPCLCFGDAGIRVHPAPARAPVGFGRTFAALRALYPLQYAGAPSKLSNRAKSGVQKPADVGRPDGFLFAFDSFRHGFAAGCAPGAALLVRSCVDGHTGFHIYGNSKGTSKGGTQTCLIFLRI